MSAAVMRSAMRSAIAAAALRLAVSLGALGLAAPAIAGQSCEGRPPSVESVQSAFAAAEALRGALDSAGGDSALVGRQGQDLSKYGLKYSHLGIATRSGPGGAWRVEELLNACGTANSDLFSDGLANFFLDTPYSYGFIVLAPPPELAARLAAKMAQPGFARSMHEPHYSMAAYPFSTKYQNSNQWALEELAAVESGSASTREQAQAWLKQAGYAPSEMHVGALERLGGRMFKANVAFDDHPPELRFSDRIRTVTVDSIKAFVMGRAEGWRSIEVDAPK